MVANLLLAQEEHTRELPADPIVFGLVTFGFLLVLIVGGQDRGVDYRSLTEALLQRLPAIHVIAMPTNGAQIAAEYRKHQPALVHDATDLRHAVRLAAGIAPPGSRVLLSPGAPSHDHFRDYEDKSAAFEEYIRALDEEDA